MRVGQRLMIAVLPAVVGVVAVAALAYWGQYQRQAPEVVIAVAAIAAVGSLVLAWWNTRYVALRIEQVAARSADRGATPPAGKRDELDAIEETVHVLHDAVRAAHMEGSARIEAAGQREAALLDLLQTLTAQLGDGVLEIQLPLHNLLDSPFGDLNENQEEILVAARTAAETADVRIRQVQRLVALERGSVPMLPKPVGVAELLRPALAIAEARASKRGGALRTTLSATMPRVLVDSVHAQDAVTMVLTELVERVPAGGELVIDAEESDASMVRVTVSGAGAGEPPSLAIRLAEQLIRAQGGSFRTEDRAVVIELPAEQLRRART